MIVVFLRPNRPQNFRNKQSFRDHFSGGRAQRPPVGAWSPEVAVHHPQVVDVARYRQL
jgi:hypothetical protein